VNPDLQSGHRSSQWPGRGWSDDTVPLQQEEHETGHDHRLQSTVVCIITTSYRLSAVVDAVSPRGFKHAVEEDILEPLGMRNTALGAGDPNKAAVITRMAKPYTLYRDWTLTPPTVLRPPLDYFSAASGLISTVVDLATQDDSELLQTIQ
jgi:hypothetical protein